jgi:hypothetical protein
VPRRTGPVVLVLVVLVLMIAAACTSSTAGRSAAPASTTAAAHHPTTAAPPAAATNAAPGQARVQFEQLLGQHALIAVRLMRSVVAAEPDFRKAATASLQANTDALSALVASAYGEAEGDRFTQVWQRHQGDLSRYAEAVTSKDTSAKKTARAALVAGCDAYGAWVAEATKGRVRADEATRNMRQHAQALTGQADAYAARDYGGAYRIEREAYEHMFMTGTTLAKASLQPKAAARLDTPPEQLRSAFAMLLGEHMELIIGAQRATFAKPEEFQAAADQINANTTAITKAMGAIVGPRKAAEFQAGWAQHVEALIAYGAAAARGDQAGKAAAEKRLDTLALGLAQYLSGIVQNRLRVGLLTGAITEHDRHLLDHVDAYAARDYPKAYAMETDGYQQMRGVADTLVEAIQRTVKPGRPVGGSQTGGGGTAHRHR